MFTCWIPFIAVCDRMRRKVCEAIIRFVTVVEKDARSSWSPRETTATSRCIWRSLLGIMVSESRETGMPVLVRIMSGASGGRLWNPVSLSVLFLLPVVRSGSMVPLNIVRVASEHFRLEQVVDYLGIQIIGGNSRGHVDCATMFSDDILYWGTCSPINCVLRRPITSFRDDNWASCARRYVHVEIDECEQSIEKSSRSQLKFKDRSLIPRGHVEVLFLAASERLSHVCASALHSPDYTWNSLDG